MAFGIRNYPGWYGSFTREQHPLALYANGTRIRKARMGPPEDHEVTPLGTKGTVLGSFKSRKEVHCAYFIEWDNRPREAILCIEWKLGPITS